MIKGVYIIKKGLKVKAALSYTRKNHIVKGVILHKKMQKVKKKLTSER